MKKQRSIFSVLLLLTSLFACNSVKLNQPVISPEKPAELTESLIINSFRNTFSEYDQDGDGFVSSRELPQTPDSFKKLDLNGDQMISFSEIKPTPEKINELSNQLKKFYRDLYREIDQNKDQKISERELKENDFLASLTDSEFASSSISKFTTNNKKGTTLNAQDFENLLNQTFIELSTPQINSSGFWDWLKDKFRKEKPPVNNGRKNPVILVQGYAEPSWYFMYGIYRNLKKNGWKVYPVNLFPNINDIREQAKIVAAKIEEIKKQENKNKVDYVAHSMGGLIGRYYLQKMDGAGNIQNYISISTPHYGTQVARLGIGEAARQMQPASSFLNELNNSNPILPGIKYTSIWTKTDEIVIPASSARLAGSQIMPDVKFVGHLLILWVPKTYNQIRQALEQ